MLIRGENAHGVEKKWKKKTSPQQKKIVFQ